MQWFRISFQLEDFGHHNAQLISKNYLTHPFFTPTQVDHALTYKEDLLTHEEYIEETPQSTPAIPLENLRIIQRLYTVRNSPLDLGKYPTYGKVQYIPPGSKFYTYSRYKPTTEVIMIGKKRRVARILEVSSVESKEVFHALTSPDLISHEKFRNLNPSEYQILAISARWIYGRFKVKRALQIGSDVFVSILDLK